MKYIDFDSLKENDVIKAMVKKYNSNDEQHLEEIEFISKVVVNGFGGYKENETDGYVFKTCRGKIILTSTSNYIFGDRVFYITIYGGYCDDNCYEFID